MKGTVTRNTCPSGRMLLTTGFRRVSTGARWAVCMYPPMTRYQRGLWGGPNSETNSSNTFTSSSRLRRSTIFASNEGAMRTSSCLIATRTIFRGVNSIRSSSGRRSSKELNASAPSERALIFMNSRRDNRMLMASFSIPTP